MPDEEPKKRPLSEIGHLFLSSVRDLHTGGARTPRRTPPGATPAAETDGGGGKGQAWQRPTPPRGADDDRDSGLSIDLTPEEFAQVYGTAALQGGAAPAEPAEPRRATPVTAVIGEHLAGRQFDRAKEYARHRAAEGERVGLIELDASEFRLMCFEAVAKPQPGPGASAYTQPAECYDARQMSEALEEMNWDVDRWLLLLPSPRVPEARALLRQVGHWVLLATCDHDGVVAGYRTLKGLADIQGFVPTQPADGAADNTTDSPSPTAAARPRLTLALLDGTAEAEVSRVSRKLAGVCKQFLDWELEAEAPVRKGSRAAEHLVMLCRPNRDKAALANPPQWALVGDFLARAREALRRQAEQDRARDEARRRLEAEEEERQEAAAAAAAQSAESIVAEPVGAEPKQEQQVSAVVEPVELTRSLVAEMVVPGGSGNDSQATTAATTSSTTTPATPTSPAPNAEPNPMASQPLCPNEVLDLSEVDPSTESILSAVLRHMGAKGGFVECPVRAPMYVGARLAVGRDRGVVLFAVAKQGLSELGSIGQAYRWLMENRDLIGMAVPQFAIDSRQSPRLRLLVDHTDLTADVLQPIMQSDNVTVQSYRMLRWGPKTGLLLEAA